MVNALTLFLRERFFPPVTIPLAMVLFGAPASLVTLHPGKFILGVVTTLLGLLILRISDDIADIDVDTRTCPRRGLVSGRISVSRLRTAACLCWTLLFFCNRTWPLPGLLFSLTCFYVIFYQSRKKIPYLVQPLAVNIIFPCIPFYATMLAGQKIGSSQVLLALFIWTAVIAHDYAHSVHGPDERINGVPSFTKSIGATGTALLASSLFMGSVVFGILFWLLSNVTFLFVFALAMTAAHIFFRCLTLVQQPVRSKAKKMYIAGFLFFIIPLAALPVGKIFNISS